MKYLAPIVNDYDLTNKKYVDGRTPYIVLDGGTATYDDLPTPGTQQILLNAYGNLYTYCWNDDNDEDALFARVFYDGNYNPQLGVVYLQTTGITTETTIRLAEYSELPGDTKVTQTNTTTNSDYRVLLAGGVNDTTGTTTSYKSTALRFNPSTKILYVSTGTTTGNIYMGLATSDDLYTAIDNLGWTSTVIV